MEKSKTKQSNKSKTIQKQINAKKAIWFDLWAFETEWCETKRAEAAETAVKKQNRSERRRNPSKERSRNSSGTTTVRSKMKKKHFQHDIRRTMPARPISTK